MMLFHRAVLAVPMKRRRPPYMLFVWIAKSLEGLHKYVSHKITNQSTFYASSKVYLTTTTLF